MAEALLLPRYTAEITGSYVSSADGATYYYIKVFEESLRQWCVERRYSQFDSLADGLRSLIPMLPPMPPKSMFFRKTFSSSFMHQRQRELGKLLNCALLADPRLERSPALRTFLGVQPLGMQVPPMAAIAPSAPAFATPALAAPVAQAVPSAPAPVAPMAQAAQPALALAAPVAQAVPSAPPSVAPMAQAAQPAPALAAPVAQAFAEPARPGYTQPAYSSQPVQTGCMQPAYAQPAQPSYVQPASMQPVQPGYAQPALAQPAQPVYGQPVWAQPVQPVYAQPAYTQLPRPTYAQAPYVQPVQPGYPQPAYAQPGYAQPGYAQPHPDPQEHHVSDMGKMAAVGLAAGAAGLVGGMLVEGALESHRHHERHVLLDPGFGGMGGGMLGSMGGGGLGFFGSEEVVRDVRTDMFGDREVRTEVIDRDMFGNVDGVRETIVEEDMFGGVREEVFVDDRW